jgi:hypothetical protein
MKKLTTLTTASMLALAIATVATDAQARTHKQHNTSEIGALKAHIEALSKRVQELEAQKQEMGPLTEKEAVTTTTNTHLKVEGQVNRAVLWHDNGDRSNFTHVDNSSSSTRLKVTGEGKVDANTVVGAEVEFELQTNASDNVDVHATGSKSERNTIKNRIADVYMKSARWGDLIAGHGKMASDETMENTDLSKTGVISAGTAVTDMAGATVFFDATSQSKDPNHNSITVSQVFNGADGLGREDRLRYNTPTFNGVSLQASHAYRNTNDMWDVALKYAGEFAGTQLAAQVAYVDQKGSDASAIQIAGNNAKYQQVNGSLGMLFPMGISLMLAAANRDWKEKNVDDGTVYFGKLGYQHSFFEAGLTAFAVDYGQYKNMTYNRTTAVTAKQRYRGKSYGAFMVQYFDRIATEIYLGARVYKLDGPVKQNPRYKDITALMLGARVKF